MFITKEKHQSVVDQLTAMQTQREAFMKALGLDVKAEDTAVLTAIQNTMEAKVDAENDLKTTNTAKEKAEKDLKAANTAKDTAETTIKEVTTALDDLGEPVAKAKSPTDKVEAVRVLLAEKPGKSNSAGDSKKDEINDDVDQKAIDSLPHNKEVDANQ